MCKVKKKVKLSSSTPWKHIGGLEVQLHLFLRLAQDGGEWSKSRPNSNVE
jgi:hypothetical protein